MKVYRLSTLRLAPLACCVSIGVSCASGAPEAKAPAVPAPTQAVAVEPSLATEPDMTPVAAPKDLIAVGRIREPGALVDQVLEWSGVPIQWRTLLTVYQPKLLEVLDIEAPIEAAVVLDGDTGSDEPGALTLVSVGLNSLDGMADVLREDGQELVEIKPGIYRVGKSSEPACAIAVTLGPSPARALCGNEKALDVLLPYMTRGLPTEDLGSANFGLRMFAEPWRARYGSSMQMLRGGAAAWLLREYAIDAPEFDRALSRAFAKSIDEAISAFETAQFLSLEGRIDPNSDHLRLDLRLEFEDSDSVMAKSFKQAAASVAPPPVSFWNLPNDASLVSWSHGGAAAGSKMFGDIAKDLLGGYLKHLGAKAASVGAVPDAVDFVIEMSGSGVAVAGERSKTARKSGSIDFLGALSLDATLPEVESGVDASLRILSDPALVEPLDGTRVSYVKRDHRIQGLAGKALRYEVKASGATAAKARRDQRAQPSSVVLLVYADAGATWLATADTAKEAEALLKRALRGGSGSLMSVRSLAVLKNESASGGGALNLQSVLTGLKDAGVDVPATTTAPLWLPFSYSTDRSGNRVGAVVSVYMGREHFGYAASWARTAMGGLLNL